MTGRVAFFNLGTLFGLPRYDPCLYVRGAGIVQLNVDSAEPRPRLPGGEPPATFRLAPGAATTRELDAGLVAAWMPAVLAPDMESSGAIDGYGANGGPIHVSNAAHILGTGLGSAFRETIDRALAPAGDVNDQVRSLPVIVRAYVGSSTGSALGIDAPVLLQEQIGRRELPATTLYFITLPPLVGHGSRAEIHRAATAASVIAEIQAFWNWVRTRGIEHRWRIGAVDLEISPSDRPFPYVFPFAPSVPAAGVELTPDQLNEAVALITATLAEPAPLRDEVLGRLRVTADLTAAPFDAFGNVGGFIKLGYAIVSVGTSRAADRAALRATRFILAGLLDTGSDAPLEIAADLDDALFRATEAISLGVDVPDRLGYDVLEELRDLERQAARGTRANEPVIADALGRAARAAVDGKVRDAIAAGNWATLGLRLAAVAAAIEERADAHRTAEKLDGLRPFDKQLVGDLAEEVDDDGEEQSRLGRAVRRLLGRGRADDDADEEGGRGYVRRRLQAMFEARRESLRHKLIAAKLHQIAQQLRLFGEAVQPVVRELRATVADGGALHIAAEPGRAAWPHVVQRPVPTMIDLVTYEDDRAMYEAAVAGTGWMRIGPDGARRLDVDALRPVFDAHDLLPLFERPDGAAEIVARVSEAVREPFEAAWSRETMSSYVRRIGGGALTGALQTLAPYLDGFISTMPTTAGGDPFETVTIAEIPADGPTGEAEIAGMVRDLLRPGTAIVAGSRSDPQLTIVRFATGYSMDELTPFRLPRTASGDVSRGATPGSPPAVRSTLGGEAILAVRREYERYRTERVWPPFGNQLLREFVCRWVPRFAEAVDLRPDYRIDAPLPAPDVADVEA